MIWHAKLGLWRVSPSLLVVPDSALADFAANRLEFPTSNNPGLLSNFSKKKTFWAIISKLWYSSETVGWKWTMWTVLSQFCWESNYRNRISTEISTRNSSTETGLWWRWLPTKFASKVPKPRAAATPRGHLGTVISCTLVAIWVAIPIGSMYAIYGNIYHQYTPNVSIYIYHTWILWDMTWYLYDKTNVVYHHLPS